MAFRLRTWIWIALVVLGAWAVFAALGPAAWQLRLGLHWLVEHFLVFFAATLLACAAHPKPVVVAAVMLPLAIGLEAAQGLTPDRTPDLATGLMAAAGISAAALLADGALAFWRWRKRETPPL